MKKRVQVLANLEPLMKMDRAELATQWQLLFKAPTPRGAQVDLLRRVLAWKLQSNNLERDSAEKFIRALRRWSRSSATVNLPVGAELVREWQGVVHKVTVIEQGFEYDGKVYSALSPIAVKITGTVGWSYRTSKVLNHVVRIPTFIFLSMRSSNATICTIKD